MAASKQASKHTHARAQCSPASVGLAQAHPNNSKWYIPSFVSPLALCCFLLNILWHKWVGVLSREKHTLQQLHSKKGVRVYMSYHTVLKGCGQGAQQHGIPSKSPPPRSRS